MLQGIGIGAALPMLGSAALAELAEGSSYATASAVVNSTRQLGAVIGIALLVVVIGIPTRGALEAPLRRGWLFAAVCFATVALEGVLLGRIHHITAGADAADPSPHIDPPVKRRAPRHAAVEPPPAASAKTDLLGDLPLFAGLDAVALAELRGRAEPARVSRPMPFM